MPNSLAIVLLLILTYFFYIYYFQYTHHNTTQIPACSTCEKYNVHRFHSDQEQAAEILQEVSKRNATLIEHLRNKYMNNHFDPGIDPVRNNHIDIIPESEFYPTLGSSELNQIQNITENEYIQERISQLLQRYNSNDIYEISPLNKSGVTSYTQDKKTLILCLRKKEKNGKGENELHDINTIMFVDIHELAHMMNNLWGHKMDFWLLFKFMLVNAVECGIYTPVNYRKHPVVYCGLLLSYNPLFDPIMRI